MGRFKFKVCRASCNHSPRCGTVIADQGAHLDEQTLASGGYESVRIKWKLSDAMMERAKKFGGRLDNCSNNKEK